MIMEMTECTRGAVGASTMRVAAFARPAADALGIHLLLPTTHTHSMAGVGRYEVQGSDKGWGGLWMDSFNTIQGVDAAKGFDATSFPTRLGPPPDSPPVN